MYRVPGHLVADLWPAVDGYATAACKHHAFLEAEDLKLLCIAGRGKLWVQLDDVVVGFAVTEVVMYQRRIVANVLAAGGRRGFLGVLTGEFLDEFRRWAAEQGADTIAGTGRPGWLRFAQREGASTLHHATAWQELSSARRQQRRQTDDDLGAVARSPAVPS